MKKRKISICAIVLASAMLICTASFYSKAEDSTISIMSSLGHIFNQYANDNSNGNIYAKGKSGIVTTSEIEQAKDFYVLSGMSETDAQTSAENYMMEREALYQKAIKEGYSVSEQEILTYIDELKSVINSAKNNDDAQAVIDQFDSEEKYWEYEYTVYEKNLPIQNYIKDLETQFKASNASTYSSNSTDTIDEQWNEYLEQLKSDILFKEAFEKVN